MHQHKTAFENIVGKGEIAPNKLFLLFPQCFLLNQIIVCPFVNIFNIISLYLAEFEKPKIGISGKGLKTLSKRAFQTVVGGENPPVDSPSLTMFFYPSKNWFHHLIFLSFSMGQF